LVKTAGWIVRVAVWVVPLRAAEIVAVTVVAAPGVLIVNVAEVAPAGMVTVVGTVAAALLEESVTTLPPLGAALLRVTVPTDVLPPTTVEGDKTRPCKRGVRMVKFAASETVPWVALIVAFTFAGTEVVVIVKSAEAAPPGTVTLEGTVALATFEVKPIVIPPGAAGPLSVTVPVEGVPPTTAVGDTVSPVSADGKIVSVAFAEEVPRPAVTVAEVDADTETVVIVKFANDWPWATITVAGTLAAALLLVKVTVTPFIEATGPLRVTVPVEETPPLTVVGFKVNVETAGTV
jgi:hypothetical protein